MPARIRRALFLALDSSFQLVSKMSQSQSNLSRSKGSQEQSVIVSPFSPRGSRVGGDFLDSFSSTAAAILGVGIEN